MNFSLHDNKKVVNRTTIFFKYGGVRFSRANVQIFENLAILGLKSAQNCKGWTPIFQKGFLKNLSLLPSPIFSNSHGTIESEPVHGLTGYVQRGRCTRRGKTMFVSTAGFTEETEFNSHDELLNEFLRRLERQAPGSDAETNKVLSVLSLLPTEPYTIVTHHCGTGALPLELASRYQGKIIAVDPRPEFLDALLAKSETMSLQATIQATSDDVVELPLVKGSVDVVWSQYPNNESSFERVLQHWHSMLKSNGVIVLTELIWYDDSKPQAVTKYFNSVGKDIATLEERIDQLEANGYEVLRGELLPEDCHTTNYYEPMDALFESFMNEFNTPAAVAVVAALKQEISFYNKYKEDYGYAVLIARKL
jgi:SAM-dependent methyltransferase